MTVPEHGRLSEGAGVRFFCRTDPLVGTGAPLALRKVRRETGEQPPAAPATYESRAPGEDF